MARKSNLSKWVRIEACKDYFSGTKSVMQISNDLNVDTSTVLFWVKMYEEHGPSVFDDKPSNKSYSKELKMKVINEYLNGEDSFLDLAVKHNISSKSIVLNWVKLYNSGKEIKDYNPKGEVYSMKSRRTTYEERLEIVEFILANDKNYKLAAEKYLLPYSLVYCWTKKYLEKGSDALSYQKRGRKPRDLIPENLSEYEKLQMENELLRRKLEYAELENKVLKKKQELEQQAELRRLGKKRRT